MLKTKKTLPIIYKSPKKPERSHLSPLLKTLLQRCFVERLPTAQISRILGISVSCIGKRRKHFTFHGTVDYSTSSTPLSPFSSELLQEIESLCEQLETPTAREIVAHLPAHLSCSLPTCRRALKFLNYSFKRVISV